MHMTRQDQDKPHKNPSIPSPNHSLPLANEDSTVVRDLVPNILAFSLRDFTKALVVECTYLSVLFISRFCREIFSEHGGHIILDQLRLYCRYLCLNMSLIGVRVLACLIYPHLFLFLALWICPAYYQARSRQDK